MFPFGSILSLTLAAGALAQTYSATYTPSDLPDKTQTGQQGTNKCGTGSDQKSMCQNLYVNSIEDWCIYGPPDPGPNSIIGETERYEVAWCTQTGYGTRLIPPGTITGAHFLQTPDYVQVTGVGDLTKMNVPAGDSGGELDPHGADGNGNPIGGVVFSSAFSGQLEQIHEWTNFVSVNEFCIRVCNNDGPNAPGLCQHIYDVMGCTWNMPGSYDQGSFDSCKAESSEPMGVYGASTFHQGDPVTPLAHPPPVPSSCTAVKSLGVATSTTMNMTTTAKPTSTSVAAITRTSMQPAMPTGQPVHAVKNSAVSGSGYAVEFMIAGISIALAACIIA